MDIDLLDLINIDIGQQADTFIFMLIALLAAAMLIVTFLLGEAFEFFGDAVDIDDGGGIFNMQTMAAFLAGFGAIAWLLSGYFDVPSLVAALGGVAGGIPMAGMVVVLTRTFMRQSISTSFSLSELVGERALVTLAIPPRGVGRIQYERGGATHTATARSTVTERIEQGTVVTIDSVVAGEVVVRAAEESPASAS
jgi:hypothetical protein